MMTSLRGIWAPVRGSILVSSLLFKWPLCSQTHSAKRAKTTLQTSRPMKKAIWIRILLGNFKIATRRLLACARIPSPNGFYSQPEPTIGVELGRPSRQHTHWRLASFHTPVPQQLQLARLPSILNAALFPINVQCSLITVMAIRPSLSLSLIGKLVSIGKAVVQRPLRKNSSTREVSRTWPLARQTVWPQSFRCPSCHAQKRLSAIRLIASK